jgi:hypothetical protein
MAKKGDRARILVSINDNHERGHSRDLRSALKNTKFSNQFIIYQDLQKKPDSHLQLTLEEILLSKAVLIDATSDEETYKDRLIKFGIAFALEKPRYFFYIRENSAGIDKVKSNYIDNFIIEVSGYYNFTELLNEKKKTLITEAPIRPQRPTDARYSAFSVLGVNESTDPDLTKTIKDFAIEKEWHAVFHKPPSGSNMHEELSRQVGARTFSLFCMNKFADASLYIAIGLALGWGVPFLIIIEEGVMMPQVLSGYTGIVTYTSNTDLTKKLTHYTEIFFSPEIFKTWEGFTYFYLLSKIEKRLNEISSEIEIKEIEEIVLAITNAGRKPINEAYILLGDVYRRKTQIINPLNTKYLGQAIFWYKKALSLQPNNERCIDGIDSTKKLIQLINLIIHKNYDSIPQLIYLIGNNINLEQYRYLKSFLLGEVKELFEKDEFLHAIALLAAIQKHDKSEDVTKLWEKVNPKNFIELIQMYQEDEIKLKMKLKAASEKNKEIFDQLSNAYKEIDQAKKIKTKLDDTMDSYGREIFVNLGIGWAAYRPIEGLPYVKRNDEKITATEGMPILRGDWVYDGDDNYIFHYLSEYESSILDHYRNLPS